MLTSEFMRGYLREIITNVPPGLEIDIWDLHGGGVRVSLTMVPVIIPCERCAEGRPSVTSVIRGFCKTCRWLETTGVQRCRDELIGTLMGMINREFIVSGDAPGHPGVLADDYATHIYVREKR